MIRISFRQGMLAGFAVILLLLGGAAVNSWLLLERLLERSRAGNDYALQLTASIQELEERTIDIERSARQYLLLDDPIFRQRFEEHLAQSLALVERLKAQKGSTLVPLLGGWQMVAEALRSGLEQRVKRTELTPLLARLVELNDLLRQAAQRSLEGQGKQLLNELEAHRIHLGSQMALALLGALLVALGMAWWLVRPVRQMDQAIARLGASRFDQAVVVGGPADMRQIGRRLDWLRTRLAELESDRERSLRHVSHELKTPLTALREGVALLQDEVPGPLVENQREVVEILRHNVIGLQQQIESLLSLNGAAFEARRLRPSLVDLKQILGEAVQRRELQISSRQIKVVVEASDEKIMLDGEKISVALDNLLSNAVDFSPEASEIRLLAKHHDGFLRIECIDQGVGVAAEDAQRIFDPFVQGRHPSPVARKGSGVGLSIVRELVRAMGGTVALLPSRQGAHFCVEIPDEK